MEHITDMSFRDGASYAEKTWRFDRARNSATFSWWERWGDDGALSLTHVKMNAAVSRVINFTPQCHPELAGAKFSEEKIMSPIVTGITRSSFYQTHRKNLFSLQRNDDIGVFEFLRRWSNSDIKRGGRVSRQVTRETKRDPFFATRRSFPFASSKSHLQDLTSNVIRAK